MKRDVLIIFFLLLLHFQSSTSKSNNFYSLLIKYVMKRDISMCYFYTCWPKNENIHLSKLLSENFVRSTFISYFDNETHSKAFARKSFTYYGTVLDTSCRTFNMLTDEDFVPSAKYLSISKPSLILSDSHNTSKTYWSEKFSKIKLRMDSDITIAVPDMQNSGRFKLLDIYNPAFQLGEKPIVNEMGQFNGSQIFIHSNKTWYQRRKNLQNITLRTGSVLLTNVFNYSGTFEEYMEDHRFKQHDTMNRFNYALFALLVHIHNYSWTVTLQDEWFGNSIAGNEGGLARLLHEDKIDITCAGATLRVPRIDFYEYLMPSYHFRPSYIFRNPGSYELLSNEFLQPFSMAIWFIIAAFIAILCLFQKKLYQIENIYYGLQTKYSWCSIILSTLSVLLQQGSYFIPSSLSGRIIFTNLLIFSILVYNFYTSSIVSSLLSHPPKTFKTLHELGRSNLEIGLEDAIYTFQWFWSSSDPDVQYIYKERILSTGHAKNFNTYTVEEGIAKVRKGGFAYHTQLDTGYPLVAKTFDQDEICDVHEIPMIPKSLAGIMLQKRSQYYELFHISLRRLKEIGAVNRISTIWESKTPPCRANSRVIAVGVDQTFSAFLVIIFGLGISLIILSFEIIYYNCNKL